MPHTQYDLRQSFRKSRVGRQLNCALPVFCALLGCKGVFSASFPASLFRLSQNTCRARSSTPAIMPVSFPVSFKRCVPPGVTIGAALPLAGMLTIRVFMDSGLTSGVGTNAVD